VSSLSSLSESESSLTSSNSLSTKAKVPNFIDGVDRTDVSPKSSITENQPSNSSIVRNFCPPVEHGSPPAVRATGLGRFNVKKVANSDINDGGSSGTSSPVLSGTKSPLGRFSVQQVQPEKITKEPVASANKWSVPTCRSVSRGSSPPPTLTPCISNETTTLTPQSSFDSSSQTPTTATTTATPNEIINSITSTISHDASTSTEPAEAPLTTNTSTNQQQQNKVGTTVTTAVVSTSKPSSPAGSPSLSRHNSQQSEGSVSALGQPISRVNSTVLEFDPLSTSHDQQTYSASMETATTTAHSQQETPKSSSSVSAPAAAATSSNSAMNSHSSSINSSRCSSRTGSPTAMLTSSGSNENIKQQTASTPSTSMQNLSQSVPSGSGSIMASMKRDETVSKPFQVEQINLELHCLLY